MMALPKKYNNGIIILTCSVEQETYLLFQSEPSWKRGSRGWVGSKRTLKILSGFPTKSIPYPAHTMLLNFTSNPVIFSHWSDENGQIKADTKTRLFNSFSRSRCNSWWKSKNLLSCPRSHGAITGFLMMKSIYVTDSDHEYDHVQHRDDEVQWHKRNFFTRCRCSVCYNQHDERLCK